MNLDPVPKMSPLCQAVERDSHKVQIDIYEGDAGKWLLEVVDSFNNSTVWDDQFQTDKLALAEAFRTIEEDGIESLVGPASGSWN